MTWRHRARRASSRFVRSSISTPARAASVRRASGNVALSRCMTKLKMSPPSPQPKQCQLSRAGVTTNEGVFSPWKGHRPLYVEPAFLRETLSPTTSTTDNLLFTSAVTPTDKSRSLRRGPVDAVLISSGHPATAPDMTVGLSSLDKPCAQESTPPEPHLSILLSILLGCIPAVRSGRDVRLTRPGYHLEEQQPGRSLGGA